MAFRTWAWEVQFCLFCRHTENKGMLQVIPVFGNKAGCEFMCPNSQSCLLTTTLLLLQTQDLFLQAFLKSFYKAGFIL